MSRDYDHMNKVSSRRRSRLATLRPDEEPDVDMLTSDELRELYLQKSDRVAAEYEAKARARIYENALSQGLEEE